jgi:YlmC/YmxH family sporulation protein
MLLSSLQEKDIIDVAYGKKIGNIIDVKLDSNGRIEEILIQKKRLLFFAGSVSKIMWNQIDKIGKDVILVNVGS